MLRGPSPPVGEGDSFATDPLPVASTRSVIQTYPKGLSSTDAPEPSHVLPGEYSYKAAQVMFPASSGSCGPGAFRLCDQGVAVARVMVPPSWAGFGFHLLSLGAPCFPGNPIALVQLLEAFFKVEESL